MKIDIKVPRSWEELSAKRLEFVYILLAKELSATEIKIVLLLRWNKLDIVDRNTDGYIICNSRKMTGSISTVAMAELTTYLDWLDRLPTAPLRPEKLAGHKALPADFGGVPFETLLIIDNYYQGYLRTKDESLLDEMGQVLYNWNNHRFLPWQRVAVFYWIASLKEWMAKKFPTLFRPVASTSLAPASVEESMNTQIRALTKGDITKEAAVLAMDCHRALAELEAQAKEYLELKKLRIEN